MTPLLRDNISRLSDFDLDRWLDETCDYRRCLADGIRGEIVTSEMTFADHIRQDPCDVDWYIDRPIEGWNRILMMYLRQKTILYGMDDCASIVKNMSSMESRMRGTGTDVAYITRGKIKLFSLVDVKRPNYFESGQSTVEMETMHRLMRLAVRALRIARLDGAPPTDQTSFLARFGDPHALDGDSDHLYLRYELVTPTRFRFGADPFMPVPNISDQARFKAFSRLGKPAREFTAKGASPYIPVLNFEHADIEMETVVVP